MDYRKMSSLRDGGMLSRYTIDRSLRYVLIKSFGKNNFERQIQRKDLIEENLIDIVGLRGFNEEVLKKVSLYDRELDIYQNYDEKARTVNCFGRRISDWVSLLCWREGLKNFSDMSLGLRFFLFDRSYVLDEIIDYGKECLWYFMVSETHDKTELPGKYSDEEEIKFKDMDSKESFEHLFSTIG